MTVSDINQNIEAQDSSVTANVCENAALYGAAPERDEFDTREVWDGDDALAAVSESFRILVQGVAPDGFQLADERESLMWGFVNMLGTGRPQRAGEGSIGLGAVISRLYGTIPCPSSPHPADWSSLEFDFWCCR